MAITNFPGGASSFGIPLTGAAALIPSLRDGKVLFVDTTNGSSAGPGTDRTTAYATVQQAVNAATAGSVILVAAGDYDEAVTITTSNLTLVGLGGRGAAAIAPSATNGVAITVEGTSAARTSNVTLINIGGEGNGTGGGLHVKGNIRRIRDYGCKFEGGAFASKYESTAAGSVGDVISDYTERAWATDGISLVVSGGGDPVTNIRIKEPWMHNITTSYIKNATTHSTNVVMDGGVFDNAEDGTEPTKAVDLAVASTTGLITGNRFATTVWDTASFALATGVKFVGNFAEAEGPSTGGGTSGRPD